MKKLFVPLLVSAFCLTSIAFAHNEIKSVNAASSVPTDIDLNDSSEAEIRDYYRDLNLLEESQRQGSNLLKNLKPILKNNQNCYSYGASATTQVWQIYEIIDRDWAKSPAKDIEGYDASTNKITGYKYGKSNSDVGSNPYIHALYVNRGEEVDNQTKAWGDHSQSNFGINQEHVWPKSLGFDDDSKPEGARGDLMHLWAGNGRVNGQYHNNYYYGYVDKTKSFKDAGNDYSYLSGNLLGVSKTFGEGNKVFEPQDSDKGDIARAIFYMVARYNYLGGGDTIDASNPNLELKNDIISYQDAGYTSSDSITGKMGILQDLLEWNKLDPVDDFEIHRNNLLFKNYSFNRNPFIDFPDWADYIWGTSSNGTYSNTPTGAANPTTDQISKSSANPVTPSDNSNKGLDIRTILVIVGIAVAVVVILVIVFISLSKRNKKKALKKVTKGVKKTYKKSTKSKKK